MAGQGNEFDNLEGASLGANLNQEMQEEQTQDTDRELIIRDGDVFVFENGVVAMTVLSVSTNTSVGKFFKVRLFSSVSDPIDVHVDELLGYIGDNNLTCLTSRFDQSVAIADKMVLNEGDVFTKNGEFYMEILADYILYLDPLKRPKYLIPVRTSDNVVAMRDYLWVVSSLNENADQFVSSIQEGE